ncbi:YdcF family protein [Kribbella sp. NPDC023855]|uniref:YdcF family protein n=1 Tax=Kribbella sp. NPDC023855 TaxID=3154698 RepID=UPI0033EEF7FE
MMLETDISQLSKNPTDDQIKDAQLIWDYHQMHHELRSVDVGIGLGSHDLGVATFAAQLYRQGLFPTLVFTGANSRTTAARFPRGEAVHYREHAITLGVPDSDVLVEPQATNTGQNIVLTRELLAGQAGPVESVLLISKPYMERRAFATCQKMWPEVEVICASEPIAFADYLESIGDPGLVVDMLVGDLQRVIEYPALGFAVEQDVPDDVRIAYERLIEAGYISRLMT